MLHFFPVLVHVPCVSEIGMWQQVLGIIIPFSRCLPGVLDILAMGERLPFIQDEVEATKYLDQIASVLHLARGSTTISGSFGHPSHPFLYPTPVLSFPFVSFSVTASVHPSYHGVFRPQRC